MAIRKQYIGLWALVIGLLAMAPLDLWAAGVSSASRDSGMKFGNFDKYQASLGKYIDSRVPSSANKITKKSIGALLKDPEFMAALIERRFINRKYFVSISARPRE